MPATSQIETRLFRALVDAALGAMPLRDEADIAAAFHADFADVQPAARAERLYGLIRTSVADERGGRDASPALRVLKRALVYERALGSPEDPYVSVAQTLADACRGVAARPLDDVDAWTRAIQAAKAVIIVDGPLNSPIGRDAAVAGAARRLAARGVDIQVTNARFSIAPAELARLSGQLSDLARTVGGQGVVNSVVQTMAEREPFHFGRHVPGRTFQQGRDRPSFPYAYLLQLGVRHLDSPSAIRRIATSKWSDLAALATDLCAVLDVEPYSQYEDFAVEAEDLPDHLSRIATFDHLFVPRQWPPSKARELLAGVTRRLDPALTHDRLGWDMADVLLLLDVVLALPARPYVLVTERELLAAGVAIERWHALKRDFVHSSGGVNSAYASPLDADKAELDFKPLFALPSGQLVAITPGIACLGFYEATTRALRRAQYPKLEAELGQGVEAVIADAFRAAGLNVSVEGGVYRARGAASGTATGECDVVVETDDLILFVEVKKKPLRRASATGDAVFGLVDLAASLFAAQAQLARHEQTLLGDGAIEFESGYVLELRGRSVERIAATWLDFGGLQDKVLLKQVFEAMPGRRVDAPGHYEAKRLAQLNGAIARLESEILELRALGKDENALFMNCWFLSAPQLMLLLDGVGEPGLFERRLRRMRHLSFRTLDFYRDVASAAALEPSSWLST